MPKVAYSEADRARIREELVSTGLELISRQGVRRTTVEQIYAKVGISRSFFYSFFPTKEDLVVEALYMQQPKVLAYARRLLADPGLSWREAVRRFILECCYGERYGIAVLSVEEQQLIFRRLSPASRRLFRERQQSLFAQILEAFGVEACPARTALFTNLCLAAMVIRRAIPATMPLFVPEAADEAVHFQVDAIVDALDRLKGLPAGEA